MCHVVEERTIVNDENAAGRKDDTVHRQLPPALQKALEEKRGTSAGREKPVPVPGPTTPQQEVLSYSSFVEKYEDIMEHYSEMKDKDEISDFLRGEGSVLFAEHAQNYLLLSCLEDEMNGKHTRMLNVARQSQYLSNITELAVSLRSPPQSVVAPFFARLKEQEHSENFEDAVRGFAGRIKNRAIEKRKEMAAEEEANYQELSKEERLGPGGLDPLEVFESLPASMQEAFQNRDTQALQDALSKMPIAEAKLHMQRCQDSGLWNSNRDGEEEEEDTHGHSHTHEHGHGHDGQCC
jgi:cell division cycle protein 37